MTKTAQRDRSSKVRILYLATGIFDKGGISRYSRYQVRAMRELLGSAAVDVFSLLAPDANSLEEPFAVQYYPEATGMRAKLRYVAAVARWVVRVQPRVIWCNHIHLLPAVLLLRLLSPRARIAVNAYGWELWSNRQWLHQLTLLRVDLLVPDCHFTARYVLGRYHVALRRMQVVWDPVDLVKFAPQPRRDDLLASYGIPVGSDYRYVLTLGRLSTRARHKGYDRLLDTVASLGDHPEIITIFGGEGDDRARLEQRVRDEGLSGRVFFLGSIPEDLLTAVYNLCDVFTLVSDRGHQRGEGLPLTPLEAAACAKPIIVGTDDGSQEAVVAGVNGFAISPHDKDALRGALLPILADDPVRLRMGQAARARIEAEFAYEGFRVKTGACLAQLGIKPNTGVVY